MSERVVCGHEKDDGDSCGVDFGLCDCHGKCWSHAACRERDRQEARSRGGKSTADKQRGENVRTARPDEAPPPPQTLEDAVRWTSWVTWATATGELDKNTSGKVTYALRAFVDALESNVEERLERVEKRLEVVGEGREPWKR